jgi:hypothetical protein
MLMIAISPIRWHRSAFKENTGGSYRSDFKKFAKRLTSESNPGEAPTGPPIA